jgi:hypothetical protein
MTRRGDLRGVPWHPQPRGCDPSASVLVALCYVVFLIVCPGCAGLRGLANRDAEFGKHVACRLPKNPTVEQVVQHVNTNVDKVQGWRSDGVKIRASGVPVTLSGSLIVEREHRLRLEVTSPIGSKEVDFGSNDHEFWVWAKRATGPGNQPAPLLFAAHEDMDLARQKLPMPFEPLWLMEALGVAPLSPEGMQMEGTPGVASIKLVSQHHLPDGRSIRKVVAVDACHGRVLEHSVYDLHGKPLVHTVLGSHKTDPQTGAVLPRYIKVDWPQAEMSLAMEFPTVEVNPTDVPAAVWQRPPMPNTQTVNLGAGRNTRIASAVTRSRTDLVRPDEVSSVTTDESFELPHVDQSRATYEQDAPAFELPDDTGRATLPSFDE